MSAPGDPPGPPPLRPFGLVLHRDGSWSHDGVPLLNRRLRAAFDRSVRYLPEERVYVVQLGRFRGQIEIEEAAFFVRSFDAVTGVLRISDGTEETLEPASLRVSPHGGALLCTVKRVLVVGGLAARFEHAAQADLLLAVEQTATGLCLRLGEQYHPLPELS
ncbi:MAG: hypothetical protein QF890_15460 [Myxococcota bacterium]|nr:hypothetical protein [Deltaproteobacteria bacterium]MCP4241334.1 hypothetical protein [bacterium]MDP6075837.1 hypothetical protein [Myxococcota bacterium]MDP7075125.1 hypothetical protein [Myxococcota bacterium]MDP7298741.1 hypothetical protein [Myxococcota bacterium]